MTKSGRKKTNRERNVNPKKERKKKKKKRLCLGLTSSKNMRKLKKQPYNLGLFIFSNSLSYFLPLLFLSFLANNFNKQAKQWFLKSFISHKISHKITSSFHINNIIHKIHSRKINNQTKNYKFDLHIRRNIQI